MSTSERTKISEQIAEEGRGNKLIQLPDRQTIGVMTASMCEQMEVPAAFSLYFMALVLASGGSLKRVVTSDHLAQLANNLAAQYKLDARFEPVQSGNA